MAKNRGSLFERDVAKYLSKWLTGSERPYQFWRSPGSGSLGTIYTENVDLKGDIIPIESTLKQWWPFCVECKNGYKLTSFWQHFTSIKFAMEDFWRQTTEETPEDKLPMLIYRKKGRRIVIGINRYVHERLNIKLKGLNYVMVCWGKESGLEDCVLYDMNQFFDIIKPNDIKNINIEA